MTPQQRKEAARYLAAFDFSGLFSDPSIGWDWPDSGKRLRVPFSGDFLELEAIAEKKGVRILQVPPQQDGGIMPSDQRKKLEKAVTPLAAEHLLIFADKAKTRQVWLWTSKLPGKPVRHRELTWEKGRSNELLLQKLTTIAFTLDEEEALDVTGVVQRLRDNLDRDKLTKRFYEDFRRQKDRFQKFIKGLGDQGILAHYTSLMLNRLMFCYFLQQKGHLDGDQRYLRTRFERVRDTLGKDKFHSFYRSFLKRLFFEGLDGEGRPPELTALIGKKIPYLNGGIFAEHPIERSHPDITIPDEAFEKIFDFFDAYQWHLDDRPIGNDREINPEVLGYVFEKYTNQKEMGAYYTKEDITEYISKNTILPFLLQKVAAKLPSDAWDLLKNDPDLYIYEPVRRGAGESEKAWQASLPPKIAVGLDPEAPDLLNRRKDWNTPAPDSHGLPTEIWRETIARHQRCHELRRKLRAGEVKEPADLVTLNLDIRRFVHDLIAAAPGDLALALWKALRELSVLDPTCGSGAFLFAALEILQPLYEGLLERFRILLADWKSTGHKHPNWEKEIGKILEAVERHPNEGYFIHKTIIVHNLYGVDIMEEAVEICKLRLFLKLAAQLEPGQDIEPLPDIDFNVRAGNTLVGYASRDEIRKAFTEVQGGRGGEQMALLGIENSLDDFRRIMEQAEDADRAFRRFQDLQDSVGQSAAEFRTAKETLEGILKSLRSQLDRFLAGQYDQKNLKTEAAFQKWKRSHEPFHWFVEFYGIMNGGGFDVIVGNPPYVESAKIRSYSLRDYVTLNCGNIYAQCTERCGRLIRDDGRMGVIVPLSGFFTDRMRPYHDFIIQEFSRIHVFHLSGDAHPSMLFDGVKYRLCTIIAAKGEGGADVFCSDYTRWYAAERSYLFRAKAAYAKISPTALRSRFVKAGSVIGKAILKRLEALPFKAGSLLRKKGAHTLNYHRSPVFWIRSMDFEPYFKSLLKDRSTDHLKDIFTGDEFDKVFIGSLINSTLFYYWSTASGNCRNLTGDDISEFPIPQLSRPDFDGFKRSFESLMSDLRKNSKRRVYAYKSGDVEYDEFYPSKSKRLLDKIDLTLGEHFEFYPRGARLHH
jgi:hypothetical protein